MARIGPVVAAVFALCFVGRVNSAEYLGKFLGKLSELHHGVSGEVYAVDGRTLHIKDFTYDGQGPGAYFYASTYKAADSRGFRLRDENNNGEVIRRYRKEGVTLTLPEGKTLNNIKIFYVWCEEFDVNFGDVKIPRNFDYPRPQKIDALKGVHSISSDNIVIVDAQTLLIPNLYYDGEAPDAKFWAGRGPKPSPQGIRIPDENGKEVPLRRYDGKTIVLTLPGDLTVFDIGHFGIWCEQFTVDFGHIQIPQGLSVPPSLKMLGVSPQSKLNCEVLNDELAFEVRWAVAGESIVLQLVAKLGEREYMSFGLSGDDSKSVMIGGDVVVAWIDKQTLKGYAQDYYLADKSQCSGPTGSCPDTRLGDNTDNVRLLNAAMVNGYSIVTYQRPLKASDQFDLPIYTNHSQAIIWAVGPLNQRDEVSFHSSYLKRDNFIDFARPAKWNCPVPEGEQSVRPSTVVENRQQVVPAEEATIPEAVEPIHTTTAPRRAVGDRRRGGTRRQPSTSTEAAEEVQASRREPTRTRGSTRIRGTTQAATAAPVPAPTAVKAKSAWEIPPIQCYEPEDGVFYAQMGPTGGKRGYPAITGHVGWGISWYINGLLIPEINVVRGKTYTFVVEGGNDPEVSAKYHPFYITDDPVGGYFYKTPEEKEKVRIYSGVAQAKDGSLQPIGTGRLCHWTQTGDNEADDFESFGAYQRTLQLKCDQGEPGVIQWTPDKDTPDTVYYQCFTHRYLGWKINVLDSCDSQTQASEIKPVAVEAPKENLHLLTDESVVEPEASPSIIQETRVMQNNLLSGETNADIKNYPPTVSENHTTLVPSTPTSEHNQDRISNSSFTYQSPQSHHINPFSQSKYPHPHTPGHFAEYNNDASISFRPSTTLDSTTDFPARDIPIHPIKKVTSTKLPTYTTDLKIVKAKPEMSYVASSVDELPKVHNNYNIKSPYTPFQQFQILHIPMNKKPILSQNLPYANVPMVFKNQFYKKPIVFKNQTPAKGHPLVLYNNKPELENYPKFKSPHENSFKILPTKLKPLDNPLVTDSFKLSTSLNTSLTPETVSEIKNVEVSPAQISTKREPDIQPVSSLISIHPLLMENSTFTPPVNTGFKPESIVIESGFKPIVNKNLFVQDRVDDDIEPEVDPESQIGVIHVNGIKKFIKNYDIKKEESPSETITEKPLKQTYVKLHKKPLKMEIVKLTIRTRRLINSDIEPEMEASDQFETRYLPPPGKIHKQTQHKQPSKIDIEAPSPSLQKDVSTSDELDYGTDVLVTYDGKKVSSDTLTAKPFQKSILLQRKGSKATEFIKSFPQFVPYKGELPPLNPDVLFGNARSEDKVQTAGVLSRDLDTPFLSPSGSTKLTRVRRLAHHTPEHTAEQMRQMNQTRNNNSTSTSGSKNLMKTCFVSLVASLAFLTYF